MQLSHKYKLGITPFEFSGISVSLLHIWNWEQNSFLFMQTGCTVFASVKNGQLFSHLWKRFSKPTQTKQVLFKVALCFPHLQ